MMYAVNAQIDTNEWTMVWDVFADNQTKAIDSARRILKMRGTPALGIAEVKVWNTVTGRYVSPILADTDE